MMCRFNIFGTMLVFNVAFKHQSAENLVPLKIGYNLKTDN